jgi:hypothetical protein
MIPSSMATSHRDRYSIVVLDYPHREKQDVECFFIPSSNLDDHDYIFQDCDDEGDADNDDGYQDEGMIPATRNTILAAPSGVKKTFSTRKLLSRKKWNRIISKVCKQAISKASKPASSSARISGTPTMKAPLTEEEVKQYISSQDDLDWSAAPMKNKLLNRQISTATLPQHPTTAGAAAAAAAAGVGNSNIRKSHPRNRSSILQPLVEIYISDSREDIDDTMSTISTDSCWYDEHQGIVELVLPNVLYYDEGRDDDDIDDGDNEDRDDNFHMLFPSYIDECMASTKRGKQPTEQREEPTALTVSKDPSSQDRESNGDQKDNHDPRQETDHGQLGFESVLLSPEINGTKSNGVLATSTSTRSPSTLPISVNADDQHHLKVSKSTSSVGSRTRDIFKKTSRRNSVTKDSVNQIGSDVSVGTTKSCSGPQNEKMSSSKSIKSHNAGGSLSKTGRNWIKPIIGCHYGRYDDPHHDNDEDDTATIFSGFWKLFELPAILKRKDQMDTPSTTSSNVADVGDTSSLGSLDDGWEGTDDNHKNTTVNDQSKTASAAVEGLLGKIMGGVAATWWELTSKYLGKNVNGNRGEKKPDTVVIISNDGSQTDTSDNNGITVAARDIVDVTITNESIVDNKEVDNNCTDIYSKRCATMILADDDNNTPVCIDVDRLGREDNASDITTNSWGWGFASTYLGKKGYNSATRKKSNITSAINTTTERSADKVDTKENNGIYSKRCGSVTDDDDSDDKPACVDMEFLGKNLTSNFGANWINMASKYVTTIDPTTEASGQDSEIVADENRNIQSIKTSASPDSVALFPEALVNVVSKGLQVASKFWTKNKKGTPDMEKATPDSSYGSVTSFSSSTIATFSTTTNTNISSILDSHKTTPVGVAHKTTSVVVDWVGTKGSELGSKGVGEKGISSEHDVDKKLITYDSIPSLFDRSVVDVNDDEDNNNDDDDDDGAASFVGSCTSATTVMMYADEIDENDDSAPNTDTGDDIRDDYDVVPSAYQQQASGVDTRTDGWTTWSNKKGIDASVMKVTISNTSTNITHGNNDSNNDASNDTRLMVMDPFTAAKRGNLNALKEWNNAHPDYDWSEIDDFGNTALYYACSQSSTGGPVVLNLIIVKYLLDLWPVTQIPPATLERCKACAVHESIIDLLEQQHHPHNKINYNGDINADINANNTGVDVVSNADVGDEEMIISNWGACTPPTIAHSSLCASSSSFAPTTTTTSKGLLAVDDVDGDGTAQIFDDGSYLYDLQEGREGDYEI